MRPHAVSELGGRNLFDDVFSAAAFGSRAQCGRTICLRSPPACCHCFVVASKSVVAVSAAPHSVVAKDGMYQQNLPQGRHVSLIRIGVPDRAGWVPEVSANRLLISVRIMRIEEGHRTQSMKADVDFLISNCG